MESDRLDGPGSNPPGAMQDDFDVQFCDLCGTSVPLADLESGAAVRHQAKTIGACCLAVLPYVGTVLLLPLSVFKRSYSVFFLEQFGREWRMVAAAPELSPDSGRPDIS